MTIVVLNGSPKGNAGVTMQYMHYVRLKFKNTAIEVIPVADRIQSIEKNEKAFDEIIDKVRQADGIFWIFPLYHLLVHSGYKRFIELIFERKAGFAFRDKYAASFSTSIKFSDHTAHNYIEAICNDLIMHFVGSFSAQMDDFFFPAERKRLELFFGDFLQAIADKRPTVVRFPPLKTATRIYTRGKNKEKISAMGKRITVIVDGYEPDSNLGKMIDHFLDCFTEKPALVSLSEIKIAGGCKGCVKCGFDNICVFDGADDFRPFFEENVTKADIVIIAGEMKDRYLSWQWKRFFDRSFFKTHQPNFFGKQLGFLVSGPLSQEANLRQILEFYPDFSQANLAGIVTDEPEDSADIDSAIAVMADKAVRYAESGYFKPSTFPGISGRMNFRDSMYVDLKLIFQADYNYYKKHGWFDFPQKKIGMRILNAVLWPLLQIPFIRKDFRNNRMSKGMTMRYQQVLKAMAK
jgi:multimeric flavodoxin WrbA